jgi:hypothetical protein
VLIVLTSPFNFAIYCYMSEQFRLTVRQLFSSRLLFVAQAQATFHGGKRYSLILVDVATLEAKQKATRRSSSRASRKSSRSGSRRSYRHWHRRASTRTEGDDEQMCTQHALNKDEIVVIGERPRWTRQTSIPEESEEQDIQPANRGVAPTQSRVAINDRSVFLVAVLASDDESGTARQPHPSGRPSFATQFVRAKFTSSLSIASPPEQGTVAQEMHRFRQQTQRTRP